MNKDRYIALGLTLLLALLIFCGLFFTVIPAASALLPKAADAEESEVFFADIDYEQILSDPTPQVDGEAASAATGLDGGLDQIDSGSGESVPDPVATPDPKPDNSQVAKPEEKKPPGPTKEEIEEQKRAAIRDKIGKATGLNASDNQASGGAESGNASTGNNPTSQGLGLDGRKLLNRPDPGVKNAQGWVRVRVTVNAQGVVTNVQFVSSSGFGDKEASVRQACMEASRQLRYSPDSKVGTQSGTICWNIK